MNTCATSDHPETTRSRGLDFGNAGNQQIKTSETGPWSARSGFVAAWLSGGSPVTRTARPLTCAESFAIVVPLLLSELGYVEAPPTMWRWRRDPWAARAAAL